MTRIGPFRVRAVVEIILTSKPHAAIPVQIGQEFVRLQDPVGVRVGRLRPHPLNGPPQGRRLRETKTVRIADPHPFERLRVGCFTGQQEQGDKHCAGISVKSAHRHIMRGATRVPQSRLCGPTSHHTPALPFDSPLLEN